MGWGKWCAGASTKAAISLKGLKIEEKLLWMAYRYSQVSTLFRTVPSLSPYGLLFPKIGGSQLPAKTPIAIISGTGKAIYGLQIWPVYIHRVHPNKSRLNILEKRERGRIQRLPNFFKVSIAVFGALSKNFSGKDSSSPPRKNWPVHLY